MLKFTLLLVFIFVALISSAQQAPKDSIIQLIEDHEMRDTIRVTLLRELAGVIVEDTVQTELLSIGDEIVSVSKEIDYEEGIVYGHLVKGRYYEWVKNKKESLKEFLNAAELAEKFNSKRLLYSANVQLARFFNRQSNNDSALFYFKRAYYFVKADQDKRAGNVLLQVSLGFYHQTQFDSVIDYTTKAFKISEKIKDSLTARQSANLLAAALKRKGDLDSALYYFNIALKYVGPTDDRFAKLRVYNNIANIYGDRGNYPKALDYYLLTLKAAEEGNYSMVKAVTYNNIAIVYYTLNEYPETISYLLKSLEISDSLGDIDNTINALNNIGELYFKIDSIDKSLKYYTRAEKLIKNTNNKLYSVYNYKGKGLLYDRKGISDSALYYFNRALKLAREVNSKIDLASTNVAMAQHYYLKNNYIKSAYYARAGFKYAKEVGSVETIRDAAEVLYKANAKLIRHKEAYRFLKVYTEMNDSLLNADNTKEITQMEMQYKHDKEIQVLEAQEAIRELKQQKEITKQKGLRNAFILAFIFVLFIIVLVVRSIKHKQKANQLLAYQKAEIEEKNEEMQQLMSEVSRQKDEIEVSHNQIKGSIRYAERIQNALLPLEEDLSNLFEDHFVFYKPLEIVSGDFYWVEKAHNRILIAAGDCTGHGVPGAMLSMLGISYLNDIARQPNIVVASQVLEKLRKRVKRSLHQTGDVREARDGMDIAFAAINIEEQTLDFAGANNAIIIFRNDEMIELIPDKQPISVYQKEEPFTNQLIRLEKGDVIYLFTDGYIDQFSGANNKKFGSKQFKELLAKIHKQPMLNQKQIMMRELNNWMQGKALQIDDILVVGFKWR